MIIEIHCTEKNKAEIEKYAVCAQEQIDNFVLHPWQGICDENYYIFIAYEHREPCPLILGWMKVHIKMIESRLRNQKTLRIAHVDYISTNQLYQGNGKQMMAQMEQSMREKFCHFVELMPLSGVIGFYTKLGYVLDFEEVNYYTKWFTDKTRFTRELEVYERQLNEEQKEIERRMEEDEQESFQPIFDELSTEEQEKYEELFEEDGSIRIELIFMHEEIKRQALEEGKTEEEAEEAGMQEVRKRLES